MKLSIKKFIKEHKFEIGAFIVFLGLVILIPLCNGEVKNSGTGASTDIGTDTSADTDLSNKEVILGYYQYEVPGTSEIENNMSEDDPLGDIVVVNDDYVLRNYYADGVPSNINEQDAIKMFYPEATPHWIEFGYNDSVTAAIIEDNTVDSKGTKMYVREYYFKYGSRLHVIEAYSYNDDLDRLEDVMLDDMKVRDIEETKAVNLPYNQDNPMYQYYNEMDRSSWSEAEEEYEAEPWEPPSGASMGRSGGR